MPGLLRWLHCTALKILIWYSFIICSCKGDTSGTERDIGVLKRNYQARAAESNLVQPGLPLPNLALQSVIQSFQSIPHYEHRLW